MSSQLVSLLPVPPLTDNVFVFNQDHFLEIRDHQEKLVSCLNSWLETAALMDP